MGKLLPWLLHSLPIIFILWAREELYFLFCPPLLFLMTLFLILQVFNGHAFVKVGDLLYETGLSHRRALWILPLGSFALQLLMILALLYLPSLLGMKDLWAELLSLASFFLASFTINLFIALSISTVINFITLLKQRLPKLIEERRQGLESSKGDELSTLVTLGLSCLLLALILIWQLAMPDNLLFSKAIYALKLERDERKALALFKELLDLHPNSSLCDTALMRAARVEEEDLKAPFAASYLYRKLKSQYPKSPWSDDAAYRLAALSKGKKALESFSREYPKSCYADDALYLLFERAMQEGKDAKAREYQNQLESEHPWGRYFIGSPSHYPWNIKNTARLAKEQLENDKHRQSH